MGNNETEIVKQSDYMQVDASEALQRFEQQKKVLASLITPDDIQTIQGKDFKKKTYWRKVATVYGVSVSIEKEWREDHEAGGFTYYFVARASAKNGLYCDGTGACSSTEKGLQKTMHNTRAIAETRAKNRAIADLLAFGEVSAEEVHAEQERVETKKTAYTTNSKPISESLPEEHVPSGKNKGKKWSELEIDDLEKWVDYFLGKIATNDRAALAKASLSIIKNVLESKKELTDELDIIPNTLSEKQPEKIFE